MRRIGDVLLATPVARSIRAAWPDARIDMLVFSGTDGVLHGNPELNEVIAVPEGMSAWATVSLAARLWRRYDRGDLRADRRPADVHGVGRGKARDRIHRTRCAGVEAPGARRRDRLRRGRRAHGGLQPAAAGAAGRCAARRRSCGMGPGRARSRRDAFPAIDATPDFAVMHVSPKFPYKAWTTQGWVELARAIALRGMTVVVAGGNSGDERKYIAELLPQLPAGSVNVAGKVDLAALAWILSRAKLYVGTDTAVTHMAAALGIPTVALSVPRAPRSGVRGRGDTPAGGASPWLMRGTQSRRNVVLIQGEDPR